MFVENNILFRDNIKISINSNVRVISRLCKFTPTRILLLTSIRVRVLRNLRSQGGSFVVTYIPGQVIRYAFLPILTRLTAKEMIQLSRPFTSDFKESEISVWKFICINSGNLKSRMNIYHFTYWNKYFYIYLNFSFLFLNTIKILKNVDYVLIRIQVGDS